MVQAHVYVSGFVQGVGYRQFVRRYAKKLGVSGWVKNLPDGRVEALVVGSKDNIDKLIKQCQKGPFLARVKNVDVVWEESLEEYSAFEVIR